MNYWPHQIHGAQEVKRLYEQGCRSVCVTAPTGSGKTFCCQIILEWAASLGGGAMFTNRRLLTSQLARSFKEMHIGVRAADFESWSDRDAPIQICSAPTEVSRVLNRREKMIKRGFTEEQAHDACQLFPAKIVLWDEAHLQRGERSQKLMREYTEKYDAMHVGITATPLGIGDIYEELVVACNNTQARECGAIVLANPIYSPWSFDIPRVRKSKTGLFSQSELDSEAKAIWSQHIVGHIFESWKEKNPYGVQTICFAPGVKESIGLAQEFWNRGVNAASISSDIIFVDGKEYRTNDQADRDEVFARNKSGEVPVLMSRFVLREGIDLPCVSCAVLATPIASLLSYIQCVGRVLRASPGKENAILIDHANNCYIHGSPNVDRDDDWRKYFKGKASQPTKDRVQNIAKEKEPEPIVCPKCQATRSGGSKCHNCGFEHKKSVRFVIQESGELKKHSNPFFKKRKERISDDTSDKWKQCYFQMRNAKWPATFNQAVSFFVKKHGYYPPKDLPLMPKSNSDWDRRVKDVSYKDLYQSVTNNGKTLRTAGRNRPADVPEIKPEPKKIRTELFDD